ncbi:hypothetical protein, partial [Streptococcus dysgalactiae]|uniref:hypothetical protein n=1 Tax=Streptococcus dysgalactiae TaxID=1334 RepID=UPI001FA9C8D9
TDCSSSRMSFTAESLKALSKVFLGIMTFPRFHLILCLLYYTKPILVSHFMGAVLAIVSYNIFRCELNDIFIVFL